MGWEKFSSGGGNGGEWVLKLENNGWICKYRVS